jgi:hypothetical protein
MKLPKLLILSLAMLQIAVPQISWAGAYNTNIRTALENTKVADGQPVLLTSVWYKVRQSLPREERSLLDTWSLRYPDFMIPSSDVVKFRQASGQEGLRLVMQPNPQTLTMEFQGEEERFLQANGVNLSLKDLASLNTSLAKLSQSTKAKQHLKLSEVSSSIDYDTFATLSAFEKANYFVNKRLVLESARKVLAQKSSAQKTSGFWGNSTQTLLALLLLGDPIQAASCPASQIECSPILYGVNRTSGASLCGSTSDSTKSCAAQSPLRKENLNRDAEDLIRSILSVKGNSSQEINDYFGNGPITREKFNQLELLLSREFNDSIQEALRVCEKAPQKDVACDELAQRKLNFNSYLVDLKSKAVASPETEKQTSSKRAKVIDTEKSKTSWWQQDWVLPTAIIAGVLGTFTYMCTKKKISWISFCSETKTASLSAPIEASPVAAPPVAPTAPIYTGAK